MVGPLGVGFAIDRRWKHIVVLGRGVGLATLAPISQLAGECGIGVTAILSARSAEFVMADDLFGKVGEVGMAEKGERRVVTAVAISKKSYSPYKYSPSPFSLSPSLVLVP